MKYIRIGKKGESGENKKSSLKKKKIIDSRKFTIGNHLGTVTRLKRNFLVEKKKPQ